MADWLELTLGELADIQTGPFGSQLHASDYVDYGIPSIMPKDIGQRLEINLDSIAYITEEDAQRLERYRVKPSDLVFSRRGDVEKCAYITDDMNGWLCGTGCLKVSFLPGALASPKFMAYYFSTRESKHWLSAHAVGTTMPNLNSTILGNFPVELPPLPEQEAITAVLASLDDKIDLLHRQNKTLETLAQTLFRHWFIDGAEDDWEERPLDEVADYLNGLACQKYPPENEAERLPVLKIKELRNGLSDQSDWATSNVSDEYIVENGDVIFSWSGSLMVKIWDGTSCVLNQHLFKVTSAEFPKWFYYLWTIYHLEKFIAIAASKATTMGHIKRGDLSNSMVLIPSQQELEKMDRAIAPLLDKLILNNRQIAKLTALRDTLLPKLMSGEVRVRLRQQN